MEECPFACCPSGEDCMPQATIEDIELLYHKWDKEKYKYFIDYVAKALNCAKKDIPQVFYSWCIKHTRG